MLENTESTLDMTRNIRPIFPEAKTSTSAVQGRPAKIKSEPYISSDDSDSEDEVIDNNPTSADDDAAALDYEDLYGDYSDDEDEDEDEDADEFSVAEQLPPAITAQRKVDYLLGKAYALRTSIDNFTLPTNRLYRPFGSRLD